ncbi:uncharacterized protein Triagg1_3714 [Trichoderma aggressivum f. europaeum]|uniref:Uncharacterized protein n=1 Tax=Trichoderma aggressivum f. europaeum TaxID=173218 RepID=A0AAE1M0X3_9HYPO|nr:hypothetical protein Triagg1_3714 [Trichoderma aggressivum f. europaeum]
MTRLAPSHHPETILACNIFAFSTLQFCNSLHPSRPSVLRESARHLPSDMLLGSNRHPPANRHHRQGKARQGKARPASTNISFNIHGDNLVPCIVPSHALAKTKKKTTQQDFSVHRVASAQSSAWTSPDTPEADDPHHLG